LNVDNLEKDEEKEKKRKLEKKVQKRIRNEININRNQKTKKEKEEKKKKEKPFLPKVPQTSSLIVVSRLTFLEYTPEWKIGLNDRLHPKRPHKEHSQCLKQKKKF
jgi:hypothetical protein